MSTLHNGPSSLGNGVFVLTRTRIVLAVSLILTWTIATILPSYRETIQHTIKEKFNDGIEHLPAVKVDWHPEYDLKSQFNTSKVALMIEPRPLPHLVPQLLHMISVVPRDWRFMFIGSNQSVIAVSRSFATQFHEANGKLDLVVLPQPWKIDEKEDVHRLLTDKRFYEEHLPGVEHLFKFESDAIMCANSPDSLNDWLDYDWAGAPRTADDRFAGNGGLSIRRVSMVKKILDFQERYNSSEPEDEWFGKRIIVWPGAKVAKGEDERRFAVEDTWHAKPLGFHVRDGGTFLPEDVWKDPVKRKMNFDYCPELVIVMPMKLERERCQGDNKQGKILTAGMIAKKTAGASMEGNNDDDED